MSSSGARVAGVRCGQPGTLARGLFAEAQPSPGLFPRAHIPILREQAHEKYADVLARHGRG